MQSGSGAGGFGDLRKEPAAIANGTSNRAPDCLERPSPCLHTGIGGLARGFKVRAYEKPRVTHRA